MMGWPCVKDFQGSFVASEHESLHVFAGRSSRLIAFTLFNKLQSADKNLEVVSMSLGVLETMTADQDGNVRPPTLRRG